MTYSDLMYTQLKMRGFSIRVRGILHFYTLIFVDNFIAFECVLAIRRALKETEYVGILPRQGKNQMSI